MPRSEVRLLPEMWGWKHWVESFTSFCRSPFVATIRLQLRKNLAVNISFFASSQAFFAGQGWTESRFWAQWEDFLFLGYLEVLYFISTFLKSGELSTMWLEEGVFNGIHPDLDESKIFIVFALLALISLVFFSRFAILLLITQRCCADFLWKATTMFSLIGQARTFFWLWASIYAHLKLAQGKCKYLARSSMIF